MSYSKEIFCQTSYPLFPDPLHEDYPKLDGCPTTTMQGDSTDNPSTAAQLGIGFPDPLKPSQLVEQHAIIPIAILESDNSSEKIACEIPPPPLWLGRAAYWFRLGFAAVILISSLLSLTSCGVSAEEAQWYPASKYFERSLLNQIVTENSSLKPSEEVINKIQVSQLAKQPPLMLVDFDNAELCGQLGCLYTIYLEKGGIIEKVYSRYLSAKLPKGVQLFEISERTHNDLPCVVVNQIAGSNLNKLNLCYDGLQYQNDDLSVVKIKSGSNP